MFCELKDCSVLFATHCNSCFELSRFLGFSSGYFVLNLKGIPYNLRGIYLFIIMFFFKGGGEEVFGESKMVHSNGLYEVGIWL